VLLSYCVVNTNGRDHLARCLSAIAHQGVEDSEVLVLDNASDDGSAEYVRTEHPDVTLIALDRRTGKAENDSTLLERAQGRYALLLNEDAELLPGAAPKRVQALDENSRAAVAAAQLLNPDREPQPTAWREPGVLAAIAQAAFVHRRHVVQQGPEVDWAQSSAMLVRREAAAEIGYFDPDFFVYSDETDFCKRLRDAGHTILLVPDAQAIHHEQLSTDLAAASRRIVEFHRNRDRYMRKHHGRVQAAVVRVLTAWAYALRALAAVFMPGHDAARYRLHAVQALFPSRGEGIREAAEQHNRQLNP
jgi:N-acetylglucosaminyl-diphospho-decaprenol L-rhamnosyltransferase